MCSTVYDLLGVLYVRAFTHTYSVQFYINIYFFLYYILDISAVLDRLTTSNRLRKFCIRIRCIEKKVLHAVNQNVVK